jgi:hypothetical protein
MADYDHHRHMAQVLDTGERTLSAEYLASYRNSSTIDAEHLLDAEALIRALTLDPTRPLDDLRRAAGPGRRLAALDVGSGEAAKSLRVAAAIADLCDLEEVVLHVVEPDPTMLAAIRPTDRVYVRRWPLTFERLLVDLTSGRATLDPAPAYATDFHTVYYRPRRNGVLPSVGRLPDLLADPMAGFVAYICEGPGQLQELKRYMAQTAGLAGPTGQEHILASLHARDPQVPHLPPIPIPNRWPFPLTDEPGQMFADRFAFLLDGNWGSRQPTRADHIVAGLWMGQAARDRGQVAGDAGWLDGPDALILAGPRYGGR